MSGTRRCFSVRATCSDFPVAIGTDSSGEHNVVDWVSDVSEAKNSITRRERGEDKELGFTNSVVAAAGSGTGSLLIIFFMVAIKNGEAEVAYQATVNISGHVLKGFLYNKGVDEKSLFPKVPLESGKSRTSRDLTSPIVNPRDTFAA
ncbi:hypothetical protein ACFE04_000093 [Oxalis oulophora]